MQATEMSRKGHRGGGPQQSRRVGGFSTHWMAVFVTCALMVLAPAASAQPGPVVWVVSSLQRVGRTDAAGGGTQSQLYAARGEYESFQIIVKAPSSTSLSNVNLSVSDLTGPGGQVIPKQNLSLFREYYVYVGTSSPNWGGSNRPLPPGWYPDGLIPFVDPSTGLSITNATLKAVPFSVSASQNQPIWVDVLVPRTATAGFYSGTFTVTCDQGSVTGQINLTVWNFTLPLKPSMKSSFLYWTAGNTAAIQELLRNRLNPERTPSASQRSMIDNYGLTSQEMGFWSGADINHCTMSAAPSVTQFQNAKAGQQSDLYLYNYTADEIDRCSSLYPIMQQWGRNMHQSGIDNLVTMAPIPQLYDDGSGTGRSAVDVWVMLPVTYDHAASNVQYVLAKGDKAWSYNCLVQDSYSPKWMIDFAPINFRIQPGFINQSLSLTGLLYWRVDDWSSDPWNNVYPPGFSNYPGEAILVYPGSTVGIQGVAPSMRLKWLRDGVDDYDYIDLLKKAGRGTWALQVAGGVGANWSQWTKDVNVLENARVQLGQQLDLLGGGGSSAPDAPGNPSPASGATSVPVTPTLGWSAVSNCSSYDVYSGTSPSPAILGNTAVASYNPGTLNAGTKYYWRVVAKNSAGSTSSPTYSFTTTTASPAGISTVSGASFTPSAPLAPGVIAAGYGANLVSTVDIGPATGPLPTVLAQTSVIIKDSAGVALTAPLWFVSPGQINYYIPEQTALGLATISVVRDAQTIASGTLQIDRVAPGLFTMNANGQGVPAALAIFAKGDGSQTWQYVFNTGCAVGACQPVPLELGAATDQAFLQLYGTGIRGRSSLPAVTARIGGVDAPVDYAGPVWDMVGLDQVNLRVPRSLIGRGEVDVSLTVDGKTANTVRVNIK